MSEHDSVLQEFMAISGVGDESRAKFYLEAANWELSLALSGFFEGGGDSQVWPCGGNSKVFELDIPYASGYSEYRK